MSDTAVREGYPASSQSATRDDAPCRPDVPVAKSSPQPLSICGFCTGYLGYEDRDGKRRCFQCGRSPDGE